MSDNHQSHHIVSFDTCLRVFGALLVLTVVTVAVSRMHLGIFNFPVAMLIATAKAAIVIAFFMGLKYDSNENRFIFLSSIIFVAIFIVLTFSDLLFRPELKSATIKLDQIPALTLPSESKPHHE